MQYLKLLAKKKSTLMTISTEKYALNNNLNGNIDRMVISVVNEWIEFVITKSKSRWQSYCHILFPPWYPLPAISQVDPP